MTVTETYAVTGMTCDHCVAAVIPRWRPPS